MLQTERENKGLLQTKLSQREAWGRRHVRVAGVDGQGGWVVPARRWRSKDCCSPHRDARTIKVKGGTEGRGGVRGRGSVWWEGGVGLGTDVTWEWGGGGGFEVMGKHSTHDTNKGTGGTTRQRQRLSQRPHLLVQLHLHPQRGCAHRAGIGTARQGSALAPPQRRASCGIGQR